MSLQIQSYSLQPFNFTKIHPHSSSRTSFSIRVSTSTTSPRPSISVQSSPNSPTFSPSLFTTTPPPGIAGFRPTPELGLLSHLFVFSMVFGAFFSVALISIPTLIIGRRISGFAIGKKNGSSIRSRSFSKKNPAS